jgi:hypothetical protein
MIAASNTKHCYKVRSKEKCGPGLAPGPKYHKILHIQNFSTYYMSRSLNYHHQAGIRTQTYKTVKELNFYELLRLINVPSWVRLELYKTEYLKELNIKKTHTNRY